MRDYARIAPTFWTGETGKAIRRRGMEGVVAAVYLMTSPHSNMLGLYYQPKLYMAHETGLGIEGATKGLAICIECSFCSYDEATEMVWVHEMAAYQIASELKADDKRVKGIQKDYAALPNCQFLSSFFDRYAAAFHLSARRTTQAPSQAPCQAPSKQGEGTGEGEGTSGKDAGASGKDPSEQSKTELWRSAVSLLGAQGMAEPQARSFIGKLAKDYPDGEIVLEAVRGAVSEQPADARAYLKATCQRLAGERQGRGRNGGGSDWTATAT